MRFSIYATLNWAAIVNDGLALLAVAGFPRLGEALDDAL